MKLQFCGAARTVTGSCYFLDTGHVKIVVDCGAFQGDDELDRLNYEDFPFKPSEIEYLFLTHAHFDHCGRLPKLVREGFKGRIIATQPTKELAEIVLRDAARLQEEEYRRWEARAKKDAVKEQKSNPAYEGELYEVRDPLFTEADVDETMRLFDLYPFGNSVTITEGLEFRMRDSGHILGSAIIELWLKNGDMRDRKIVFSGDLGQTGQRIVRDPDMIREADYVIVESTYGNRLHRSKDDTILELLSILKTAKKENGNVLIPTFAIERAQEVVYEMNLFVENKLIDQLEVYLDSPMALKATEVFKKYPTFYDEDARRLLEKGDDPFAFEGFKAIESSDDSKRLVGKKGVVIMAGSGMCTGGRIVHHLANNLSNKNNHVVFVGYQVAGTLGRRIVDREPIVRIKGQEVEVKAQIHTLGGFSAHADMRDLTYWLRGFGHTPRGIYVVHGEESIATAFAANIKEELRVDTHVPFLNEVVTLD